MFSLKRLFDIFASATLILLLSPIMIIVAMLISVFLGMPFLFTQVRPGLHGNPFKVCKFRTMTKEQDASGNLLPDDQRLPWFGSLLRKLSLDELPQLFNVLRGGMSLVGPRPLLMEYLPLYSARQARRHEVLPGITGWAQVNGRNLISWEEKLELDVFYVENSSFLFDLKILILTLWKVIRRDGIAPPGRVSVEKFTGSTVGQGTP